MGRKSVAVLDVRSSEIALIVGERGINRTFVFKASKTEPYDGYQDGQFYDVKGLEEAISSALSAAEQICGERIREIFVGVPGEFTHVIPKEQNVGFPKKRRIVEKDLTALFESGEETLEGHRFIRAASMIYVTADNRRVIDPTGLSTTGLSGVISYFYCTEYFASTMEDIFKDKRITLRFLPTQLAMASYLIPSETRDEYALFLDAGFLSSTICVVLGGGILAQRTYWAGRGQIAVKLMERFNLPYNAAVALLSRANLYAKGDADMMEFIFRGVSYDISVPVFIDTVKEGLDELCECVGEFLEDCSGRELDYKPLYVSGEGICDLRGALEHLSKRMNRVCEQVTPDLPYYNKPAMSSRIALMDMAYEDHRKSGILYRILNA